MASTLRGIGPPRQSEPLNYEAVLLMDLPVDVPIVARGPINTKALAVLFTCFLLREMEGFWPDVPICGLTRRSRECTGGCRYPKPILRLWGASENGDARAHQIHRLKDALTTLLAIISAILIFASNLGTFLNCRFSLKKVAKRWHRIHK